MWTIGRDGFLFFAQQARNGFVGRENCFFAAPFASPEGSAPGIPKPHRKTPGGWSDPPGVIKNPGLESQVFKVRSSKSGLESQVLVDDALDHAEHDRADQGDGDVRGDHAQPADQTTRGHWQTSRVYVTARSNEEASKRFRAKKVSLAVHP
jgi:hypothetical protein